MGSQIELLSPQNLKDEIKGAFKQLNPQQQNFVALVKQGIPAGRAYDQAGYKCKDPDAANSHASRLMRNGKVKRYLLLVEAMAADANSLTAQYLALEMYDNAIKLKEAGDFAQSTASLDKVGKYCGIEPANKSEFSGPGGAPIALDQDIENRVIVEFVEAVPPAAGEEFS